MNNYNYGYGYQPQFSSNKLYVTSVEDALGRYAGYNTIIAYFLQDESGVVEVTTDMYGKKYSKIRKLTDVEPATTAKPKKKADYVTRAEFDEFKSKFNKDKEVEDDDIE